MLLLYIIYIIYMYILYDMIMIHNVHIIFKDTFHTHIYYVLELEHSRAPMPKMTVINKQSKAPIVQRSDDITAEYTLEWPPGKCAPASGLFSIWGYLRTTSFFFCRESCAENHGMYRWFIVYKVSCFWISGSATAMCMCEYDGIVVKHPLGADVLPYEVQIMFAVVRKVQ